MYCSARKKYTALTYYQSILGLLCLIKDEALGTREGEMEADAHYVMEADAQWPAHHLGSPK